MSDPVTFAVKRTWTAAALGVSVPLGGLGFSSDGSVLYVVGSANENASKLMALLVTRDPVTGEVLGFGPATVAFSGKNPRPRAAAVGRR